MVADMLSLYGAYLEAKQNKHKDEGDIGGTCHDFIPEEIREAVLENEDSFRDVKSIKKYMQGKWSKIHEEFVRSSYQR